MLHIFNVYNYMAKTTLAEKITTTKEKNDYISVFPNNVGSFGYDPWGFNIKGVKKNTSFHQSDL